MPRRQGVVASRFNSLFCIEVHGDRVLLPPVGGVAAVGGGVGAPVGEVSGWVAGKARCPVAVASVAGVAAVARGVGAAVGEVSGVG